MPATVRGIFQIIDRASRPMRQMEKQAQATDRAVMKLGASLDALAGKDASARIEATSASMGGMADSTRDVARAHRDLDVSTRRSSSSVDRMASSMGRAKAQTGGLVEEMKRFIITTETLARLLPALKIPALIAGIGMLLPAVASLGGGLVALVPKLGDVVGLAGALPAMFTAMGLAMATVKLATKDLDKALAGNKQALANLTPEAVRFVETLKSWRPIMRGMRQEAQRGLFPGLEKSLEQMKQMVPLAERLFRQMGRVLGVGAQRIAGTLTSGRGRSDLTQLGDQGVRIMRTVMIMANSAVKAVLNIAVSAKPFTEWLRVTIQGWAKWAENASDAARHSGRLEAFFQRSRDSLTRFGHILKNLAQMIGDVMRAARPLGEMLWGDIERATKSWRDFTKSFSGQVRMRIWFQNLYRPLHAIMDLLGSITGAIARLSSNTSGVTPLAKALQNMVPHLENIARNFTTAFGPALISSLTEVVRLFDWLTTNTIFPLQHFLDVFAGILKTVNDLITRVPMLGTVIASAVSIAGVSSLLVKLGLLRAGWWKVATAATAAATASEAAGVASALGGGAAAAGGGAAAARGAATTAAAAVGGGAAASKLSRVARVARFGRAAPVAAAASAAGAGAGLLRRARPLARAAGITTLALGSAGGALRAREAEGDFSSVRGLTNKARAYQEGFAEMLGMRPGFGLVKFPSREKTQAQFDQLVLGPKLSREEAMKDPEVYKTLYETVPFERQTVQMGGRQVNVPPGSAASRYGPDSRMVYTQAPQGPRSYDMGDFPGGRDTGAIPPPQGAKLGVSVPRSGFGTDVMTTVENLNTRLTAAGEGQLKPKDAPKLIADMDAALRKMGAVRETVSASQRGVVDGLMRELSVQRQIVAETQAEFRARRRIERIERGRRWTRARREEGTTRGRRANTDLGQAFNIMAEARGPEEAAKWYLDRLQDQIQRGGDGPKGTARARQVGGAAIQLADQLERENPKLKGVADDIRDTVDARFKELQITTKGRGERMIGDTKKNWKTIRREMVSEAERANQEVSKQFTNIQLAAVDSLTQMGYTQGQARAIVRGAETTGRAINPGTAGLNGTTGGRQITTAATGGRVPGQGLHDHILIAPNTIAAPGELVVNRHTESRVNDKLRAYGTSLEEEVRRERRPHDAPQSPGTSSAPVSAPSPYQGILPGLRMGGRMVGLAMGGLIEGMRDSANASGNMAGPNVIDRVVSEANRIDALRLKYTYGGGHGTPAPPDGPFDCSSSVSRVFQAAGMSIPTMTSGAFLNWGKPGIGRLSVAVRPGGGRSGHVYMIVNGKAWGTSPENPGGGPGWINGYVTRPGFVYRHLEGAEGMTGYLDPSMGLNGGSGAGIQQISLAMPEMNQAGLPGILSRRAVRGIVTGLQGKINQQLTQMGGSTTMVPGGNFGTGSAAAQGWIMQAMNLAGVSGEGWLNMLMRQAQRESGFNPNAINNWDSNARAGTPSKGLLQTIDSTFNSYALPGHGNIFNPVDNATAAIRYMISRYGHGNPAAALQAMIARGGQGYSMGGRVEGLRASGGGLGSITVNQGAPQIHVNVGPITINGGGGDHLNAMIEAAFEEAARGLAHSLADGLS